ncbi:MAG: hypothetical protein EOO78_37915 [Oxalobacteraceae bacterium]|nr:MAG: hypothetical protein EOO78_37915 [Oxalobacteraceae bacterium]
MTCAQAAEEAIGQHIEMTSVAEDRLTGVPQREIEQAYYTGYVPGPDGVRCTIELPVSESMRLDSDDS